MIEERTAPASAPPRFAPRFDFNANARSEADTGDHVLIRVIRERGVRHGGHAHRAGVDRRDQADFAGAVGHAGFGFGDVPSGGFIRFVSFVARTATPASVVEGIRAEIRRAAPDLPIASTATMDEAVAASVAQPRFRILLLGLFAMTATLLATCGIYGLMAYAVTQRRREIGVRRALGAERRDVLRLVLTRALRIVVAALIVGLAGAAGVTRVLQRFLFGVTPTDPIALRGSPPCEYRRTRRSS